jgi:hypothetical protein
MSKIGAVILTSLLLAVSPLLVKPVPAAEVPHRIARDAAWGCRDKHQLYNLLFMAMSTRFDDQLAQALAEGTCIFFKPGENVTIVEDSGSHGVVKVRRDGAEPATYWTPLRNIN